jgi:DNA-directed RNA polymerase subunit RPC12/RpoP
MMRCLRCGDETPRLTPHQIHCLRCAREVAALIAADERRRTPRFGRAKDLTEAMR